MQPQNPPASQTLIKTSLPYCLHRVDTRFFKLKDEFNSKIRFIKVETTPNRRTRASKNMEVIRDRWGIDAHSDVEIITNKQFADIDEAEIFALKLINDFIRRYRYYDRTSVHLVTLTKEDLFGLNLISNGQGVFSVSFAGGMTVANPLLNYKISSNIEHSIASREDLPLWEELLLNSEQYLYQLEYRHSVLESIIALELVLSDFIRNKCKQKGISKKETDEYIQKVGVAKNIKVTLKLLLGNKKLPEKDVLEKCKASITIRNRIVHQGFKNISETEAQDALNYSKKLINFLNH